MDPKRNDLTALLEQQLREAYQRTNAEVKSQRARNHRYYAGDPFGDEKKGKSAHISMDVFDAVESKKAYYLESLNSSRKPCKYMPEGEGDSDRAEARTSYVHDVFYNEAGGWAFVRDSLHDAFVAKRCVARVEFRPSSQVDVETVQGVREEQLAVLQMQDPSIEVSITGAYEDGTMDAEIRRTVDMSSFDIELVQPERFYRDGNAPEVRDAQFATEVWSMTRGEAIERGWDPEAVAEMQYDRELMNTEEDASRQNPGGGDRGNLNQRTNEQELVTAYLTHTYLNTDHLARLVGEGAVRDYMRDARQGDYRLFRIVWSRGVLLEIEEAKDGMPYLEWTEFKVSHAEFGLSEADVQSSIQRTKSTLQRLIINNQAAVNTSRVVAREKMIKNPRELLENNIGGVIWSKVDGREAITPLPTPALSPASFGVLEMLDSEKENRSGLSRLSKGMNQDAISHQNADRMIERLTNASNRRVMRGVRDYAENFLKPLFIRILELGTKYDQRPRTVEISGRFQQILPTQLGYSERAQVSVALTPDETQKQAQLLMMLHQLWMQDPVIGQGYQYAQRHALMDDVLELMGQPDSSRYLMRPDSPEYQQMMMSQQQMSQAMQQMQAQMQQLQAYLMQSQDRREWTKVQGELVAKQADTAMTAEEMDLKERAQRHKEEIDREELEIERTQKRNASIG